MGSGGITQTKTKKKGESNYADETLTLFNHHKPLKNLESLNVGSPHKIQTLKEAPATGCQG